MENPHSSGLARSIRDLFGTLTPPAEEETQGAEAQQAEEARLAEGAAEPAGDAEPTEEQAAAPPGEALADAVGRYLEGGSQVRDGLAPEILKEAAALRASGHSTLVVDAVVALSLGAREGDDDTALALARELLHPSVATELAVRIGTERDDPVRQDLYRVASAHAGSLAPALTEALAEAPGRAARRFLMEALRFLGEPGREALIDLLEDERWYAVRNGVVLLAEVGGEDTVQALTVPLGHQDPRVRRETVMALGKLGGEDAGLLLVGMLEDSAPEVRAAAAMGVGALRVERAQRVLEEMLENEEGEEVLVPVIRALGQLGDPGPVPAIEKRATGSLFTRPSQEIRISAYRALAAIGTPRARSVLESGAEDKDPAVRSAVSALLRAAGQEDEGAEGGEESTGPSPQPEGSAELEDLPKNP